MTEPRHILVVCTGNRCRSQMAEGWLRHVGGSDIQVRSAGTQPKGVHPLAIRVMAECGVDISGYESKAIDPFMDQTFDEVVTVCNSAREACPVVPGAKQMIHRPFDDPDRAQGSEEEVLRVFRRVRDQIRDWALEFVGGNKRRQCK